MNRTGSAGTVLLDHLPAIYRERGDSSLAGFLSAFEAILFGEAGEASGLEGLEQIVNRLPMLMQPRETPDEFLPWLASCVALAERADLDTGTRRELIARAVSMYRWRGTKRGLEELLALVTRGRAVVTEPGTSTLQVGVAILGATSRLGPDLPHVFEVRIEMPGTSAEAELRRCEALARAFVDQAKPAHTHYKLTVAVAGASADPVGRGRGVR